MATIYYNGEKGKITSPLKFQCFIMYKDQYLGRGGEFTTDIKAAAIAPSRSAAKQFVKQRKGLKVVPLTQADYDELIVKPAQEAANKITTEGGETNE